MSIQTWQETIAAQNAAGTAFGTFTTAKTVILPTALISLPPNYLYAGKLLRVRVRGAMGTLVTTPGTCVFQVMMGAVIAWTSGNIQLNATAHTSLPFTLDLDLRVDTIGNGTTAKLLGIGTLSGVMFTKTIAATDLWGRVSAADAAVSDVSMQVPITAPAVGTGFDSTIATVMDFFAGFSVSSASNTIQIYNYYVEALN